MNPLPYPAVFASQLEAALRLLSHQTTPEVRRIRQDYSRRIRQADPDYVLAVARQLFFEHDQRWVAYEILAGHKTAFRALGPIELEEFGCGIDSWWTVDAFARTLSGPAWRDGQVPDSLILGWAQSPNPWWRRAALVSTVALNIRSQGGRGDLPRTLAVCRLLVDDHEDMVEKALSWALRALVPHDPHAVQQFLDEHKNELAARVRREVRNKLTTGVKTPKRKAKLK